MKTQKPNRGEGFWWSEQEHNLPMPEMQWNIDKAKKIFLKAFHRVQMAMGDDDEEDLEGIGTTNHYKGWSTCRVCGKRNGSMSYTLEGKDYEWTWPGGLEHYIEEHNIKPSKDFRKFILREARRLR